MQHLGAIGEDESEIDVGRRLLGHARQRREDDLLRLTLDHLDDRHAFDALFRDEALECGGFENPEPDIEPDRDHNDAEQERDAPAPDQELVAGNPAEHEYREVGQQQAGGSAELRPGSDKAAMLVGACPLHRQQYRAAPFATDPDTLDEADDRQHYRAPDPDRLVSRDQTDREGRQPGDQQGRYQRRLAADAVAVMAEDRGADRTRDKPDGVDREGLQHADQGIGFWEEQLAENQPRNDAVEQEIVPFDRGAHRAGDDRTAQLPPVLGLG